MVNQLRAANWRYIWKQIVGHLYNGYALATPLMATMSFIIIARIAFPENAYITQYGVNQAVVYWYNSMPLELHLSLCMIYLVSPMIRAITNCVNSKFDNTDDELVAHSLAVGVSMPLLIINIQTGLLIEYSIAILMMMFVSCVVDIGFNMVDFRVWKGQIDA
jgi:hypothetical protein